MTEERIKEIRVDVKYIYIKSTEMMGWYHIKNQNETQFTARCVDKGFWIVIPYSELANRDDVEFYMLTKIDEEE